MFLKEHCKSWLKRTALYSPYQFIKKESEFRIKQFLDVFCALQPDRYAKESCVNENSVDWWEGHRINALVEVKHK